MGVKEGKGTGKTMLRPGFAWKCQAWESWLCPSGVYSTRWEVSQRRLLSSGESENCGGATWSRVLEGLGPLAPRRIPPVASQGVYIRHLMIESKTIVYWVIDMKSKPLYYQLDFQLQNSVPFIFKIPVSLIESIAAKPLYRNLFEFYKKLLYFLASKCTYC